MEAIRHKLREKHDDVFVIVSPPRCSSTALARVFWEHPSVRYYCHEPFESHYYSQDPVETAMEKINNSLDLQRVKKTIHNTTGNNLVIKEMPYQVGKNLDILIRLATRPIIFLIRDPRKNIASRIKNKVIGGAPKKYPFVESGWHLIQKQIGYCRKNGIPFCVIDSRDFRNEPKEFLGALFQRIGLQFTPKMLSWRAVPDVELDNLGGPHQHLYHRILNSRGLVPDKNPAPRLEYFSSGDGFRKHVQECLIIYQQIRQAPERVQAM
jgi:hypothetical protein